MSSRDNLLNDKKNCSFKEGDVENVYSAVWKIKGEPTGNYSERFLGRENMERRSLPNSRQVQVKMACLQYGYESPCVRRLDR